MVFRERRLNGAYTVEPESQRDARGSSRSFCLRELESNGPEPGVAQSGISYNRLAHRFQTLEDDTDPRLARGEA
jgi:dTDP-4-dehydrorhamnose 3,5-epimerase-like enzyme